jgi:hypothetical protein
MNADQCASACLVPALRNQPVVLTIGTAQTQAGVMIAIY